MKIETYKIAAFNKLKIFVVYILINIIGNFLNKAFLLMVLRSRV